VGGITEARRVADLAALYHRPFTHHDCSGPVNLAVGVHLSVAAETGFTQEIVRSHLRGWYAEAADGLPPLEAGSIGPRTSPGHGIALRPEFLATPGITREVTEQ
jgi:galactonate dehydratase